MPDKERKEERKKIIVQRCLALKRVRQRRGRGISRDCALGDKIRSRDTNNFGRELKFPGPTLIADGTGHSRLSLSSVSHSEHDDNRTPQRAVSVLTLCQLVVCPALFPVFRL